VHQPGRRLGRVGLENQHGLHLIGQGGTLSNTRGPDQSHPTPLVHRSSPTMIGDFRLRGSPQD
jgi:hypothetical protein